MIELRTPAEIEAMRPAGRFVAEVLATLRDETKVGHEPAGDRPPRARPDPARRRRVVLHRLPPLVRRQPVRQGHLHLGQRRRAARPALRLRAAGRRPRLARLRRVGRRLGRRLGRLVRRRHRRATRISRSSTRPNGRWMPRSRPPSSGNRIGDISHAIAEVAHADGYDDQHRLRRSRRRADHARRPARAQRRQGRAAATRCAPAWWWRSSRGSCRPPTS